MPIIDRQLLQIFPNAGPVAVLFCEVDAGFFTEAMLDQSWPT